MPGSVFICSSSFGARYVVAHGQGRCAEIAARSGAKGIEIRQELLGPNDGSPETLGNEIAQLGIACHYSSTESVWLGDHLNDKLQAAIETAHQLKAPLLKLAIGGLPSSSDVRNETLNRLASWLQGSSLILALENDQTELGGTPEILLEAVDAFKQAGINSGITYDTGNWQWVGVNASDAAYDVGKHVVYVHCKGVRQEGSKLHAAPPSAPELAQWSSLWSAFPKDVARSIEFPLVAEDAPEHDEEQLIAASTPWVTRLGHL